ncbi:hypothetical protein [Streptomyces sp. NPDC059378]|uniref:hypothetical protein n=1 Tax=Streptomyces sp. NPDC059378 TaxID=3346815 RepID=UPI0036AFF5BD
MADSISCTITTDEARQRLGQHLLAVVREQDARITVERRAPRTVAEMRVRLAAASAIHGEVTA